jgi:tetratricopeptide (TPR) repeat protein
VVALNAKANLLAKTERLAEAIELYQSIPDSIASPYTRCGLGFLLLKRNSSIEDIVEAESLFAEAEYITPRNIVVLLGLWITHARLGNAEEAENFQRRFEECQNAQKQYNSLLNEEDLSKEEKAFNVSQRLHQLKKLINVSDMAEPGRYQSFIDNAFPVILNMMSVENQYKRAA